MSNQNYAPPEGFTLDTKSGRFYRYDHNDGVTQWITWFDANTGKYEQSSFPAQQNAVISSTGGAVAVGGFDPDDIHAYKLLALLSYFGPLFLVPLFFAGPSKFAGFHAKQGMRLFLIMLPVNIITGIMIFWVIGLILFPISAIFTLYCILCGVQNVLSGRPRTLPFIGGRAIL